MLPKQLNRNIQGNGFSYKITQRMSTTQAASVRRVGAGMQLVVPLTTKQQCSFPLRSNQNIRQLIQEIRVEDPAREFVTITDLNGNRYGLIALIIFICFAFNMVFVLVLLLKFRMSHSTSLQHLLKHPFCVKLDGESYQITPPAEDFKKALGNVEVEELTQQVYYQKIKERLVSVSEKRSFILYSYGTIAFIAYLLF
jgi:hypothetical protein